MKETELIASLQALVAKHGDLLALSENGEADYDEHGFIHIGEFVPSGNKYCGGDWAKLRPTDEATSLEPIKALYLSNSRDPY